MDKRAEFTAALKTAMKEKDQIALSTVRLILAALKDRDLTAREKGNAEGLSDAEILQMLQSMIKQRQESSKTYSEAGRCDLAEREESEIELIRGFMPKQLNDEDVDALVEQLIQKTGAEDIKDMGKVMAALKANYSGQVDMGKAGAFARQKLG